MRGTVRPAIEIIPAAVASVAMLLLHSLWFADLTSGL